MKIISNIRNNPRRLLIIVSAVFLFLACFILLSEHTIGHYIIESAYKGESLSILNSTITGQSENPLSIYLAEMDRLTWRSSLLLVLISVVSGIAYFLPSHLLRWFAYIVAVLTPPVYMMLFIAEYQIDLPVDDHWKVLSLLDRLRDGTLNFEDIWQQDGEHRMFIAKIIMLSLAHISNWNVSYEIFFNVCLLIALFVAISLHLIRATKHMGHDVKMWPFMMISILIFSLSQWENFFLPMQWFVVVVSVVVGILVLANSGQSWVSFAVGIGLGVIATYSSAHGLLYWPIGLAVLITVDWTKRGRMIRECMIWTAVSVVVIFFFFYGLEREETGNMIALLYSQPLDYIQYVMVYIGAPIVRAEEWALLIGVIGIITFLALGSRVTAARPALRRYLVPYVAIGLFAIGSAILTALGRLEWYGIRNALSSRYITVSLIFWVGLVGLVFHECSNSGKPAEQDEEKKRFAGYALTVGCCALILVSMVNAYTWRTGAVWNQFRYLKPARDHVMSVEEGFWRDDIIQRLDRLSPPETIKERLKKLKRQRLAAFRDR
jgi:hypothetical protein